MNTQRYWRLLMEISPSYEPGGWGFHRDISELGYADLAMEVEEKLETPFDDFTKGKFSESVRIIDVLEDNSLLGLLDDGVTQCLITKDQLEFFPNFEEQILSEYLERLEKENNVEYSIENEPKFDLNSFREMIKKKPWIYKPFSLGGYFEHPSTIEESKAALNAALQSGE